MTATAQPRKKAKRKARQTPTRKTVVVPKDTEMKTFPRNLIAIFAAISGALAICGAALLVNGDVGAYESALKNLTIFGSLASASLVVWSFFLRVAASN